MTITPTQLRESAARQRAAAPDGATVPLADELEAAAAEIARLRLTDAERDAVGMAIDLLNGVEDVSAGASSRADAAADTLHGLLERMK